MIKHNRYDNGGYREAKARVPTRRQLEQWVERWGVHAQSEQCADEYEYEHWLSLRQELRAPSRRHPWLSGLPEWSVTTVAASAHEDLPLVLSEPLHFGLVAKYDSSRRIPRNNRGSRRGRWRKLQWTS